MVSFLRFLVWFLGGLARPFRHRWRPGGPIECLLVGYGGAANTGAEARTVEAIRQMFAADEHLRITLTSLDRTQTLRYLDETERLRVAEINPVFLFSVLKLVLHADVVVLIEGSCFKENFSAALLWFFLYATDLAQRFGIPTVAYGVDAGVLSRRHVAWVRDVVSKMDLLMVRTEGAAQTLRSIGVTKEIIVTTDTAFTVEPESEEWADMVLDGQGIDASKTVVGIAFEEFFWWPVVPSLRKALFGVGEDRYKSIYYHSWGKAGKEKSRAMKEAVAAYADWAADEHGAQIVFFAMERLDIGPCRDVMSLMKTRSILVDADHANARQITALLRRLNWLVTCRYHALVLAMGGLVPAIGLAHDERIAAIIDELGLIEDAFIFYDDDRILEQLKTKTRAILGRSGHIRRRIEDALPRYLSRMAINGRCFAKLIRRNFPEQDLTMTIDE